MLLFGTDVADDNNPVELIESPTPGASKAEDWLFRFSAADG